MTTGSPSLNQPTRNPPTPAPLSPAPPTPNPLSPNPPTPPAAASSRTPEHATPRIQIPRHWHQPQPWQTNAALLLLGAGLFFLSRQLVFEYDAFTLGFSGVSSLSIVLYLAAVFLILTQPVDRFTFPILLTVAILCRLIPLFNDPFLSSDVFRYVWDGVVQHAHLSPYRYVPADPALTFLRAPNQDIFDNINRRDYAHTIYPPGAQALFYLVTFISPTLIAMKSAMLLFEGLTLYTLIQILHLLGLRREQSLLFAWCPLLVWEIAGSGHLDAAAMAWIALALLFRLRRQPVLTGLFLGLAVMTKLYPIVLLPALLLPRKNSRTQPHPDSSPIPGPAQPSLRTSLATSLSLLNPAHWDWTLPATTFAVIALGYAAYSGVGRLVFGFLGGYVQEEGMATGTRYFFLELAQHLPGLHHLPPAAFYLLCAAVFAALTWWSLATASDPEDSEIPARSATHSPSPNPAFLRPAFALATALMLLFSPHYPWYILWLLPFFTLIPNLPILAYLMAFFYLFTTELADGTLPKMYILNKLLYGTLAIAVILWLALRRSALRRRNLQGLNFHQQAQNHFNQPAQQHSHQPAQQPERSA